MERKSNDTATMTILETANFLGISRNLTYFLAKNGKIPGVIRLGGRYVVSRKRLEDHVNGSPTA
jgi:excisionase family DNA binding protein